MINLTKYSQLVTVNITLLFREFLEYLVQLEYSDSVENLLEGVFQRAFFDEFIYYLAKKKMFSPSIINHIKDELMD